MLALLESQLLHLLLSCALGICSVSAVWMYLFSEWSLLGSCDVSALPSLLWVFCQLWCNTNISPLDHLSELHPIRFSHETRSIYFRTYKGLWNELSGPGWRSLYSYLLRVGRSGDQIPVGQDFPHASRPALGPTQLSLHWVWVLSPRKKNSQSMAFTTYPHLPLRLKKE